MKRIWLWLSATLLYAAPALAGNNTPGGSAPYGGHMYDGHMYGGHMYGNMHHAWGLHSGWGLLIGAVVILFFIAVLLLLLRWFGYGPAEAKRRDAGSTALELLQMRFAKGEIDAEEYQERKRLLSE